MQFTSTNTGIVLNSGTQNPATIVSGAYISNTGAAVEGLSPTAWTISNYGTIVSTGSYSIELFNGGSVGNASDGLIQGKYGIVVFGAAGTVTNSGTITASDTGAFTAAVYLDAGGSLTNAQTGTISGVSLAIAVKNQPGTIVNYGTIAATGASGIGVDLHVGGSVTNHSGGLIAGGGYGVSVSVSGGTVTNSGTIAGGSGVYLHNGGSITNNSGGLIAGGSAAVVTNNPSTVANYGTIAGYAYGVGLEDGGSVINHSGGLIDGYSAVGVLVNNTAGTVVNYGTIAGYRYGAKLTRGGSVTNDSGGLIAGGNDGVVVNTSAGTVVNSGTIRGAATAGVTLTAGVYLTDGGRVTNTLTGTISAAGVGVGITGAAGTVINDGTIFGNVTAGVGLLAGGYLSNAATGIIAGPDGGVAILNFAGIPNPTGTLVNFGTIVGTGAGTNGGSGVELQVAGGVTNAGTGLIGGTDNGVHLKYGGGSVINQGTIVATGGGSSYGASGVSAPGGTVVNSGIILATGGTGTLFGTGVSFYPDNNGSYTNAGLLINSGTIAVVSGYGEGVGLYIGASVTNQAGGLIEASGGSGISGRSGTIINYGTIAGSNVSVTGTIFIDAIGISQGTIVNGNPGYTQALITAYGDGISTYSQTAGNVAVVNYGTIAATQRHTSASSGFVGFGVQTGGSAGTPATVSNFGTITSAETDGAGAVLLNSGGLVINGKAPAIFAAEGTAGSGIGAPPAVIAAPVQGIGVNNSPGTVFNYGTIAATGSGANGNGINLGAGGTIENIGTISAAHLTNASAIAIGPAGGLVVNGSPGSPPSLIYGYHIGIGFFPPSTIANPGTLTVVNYGTILSTQPGTAAGTGFGGDAVQTGTGGVALVENFGTIAAAETNGTNGAGIALAAGSIVNEAGGTITGPNGAGINLVAGSVTNYGTIFGVGSFNSAAFLNHGGIVTNGAANNTTALIDGLWLGVNLNTIAGTVVNFGTIEQTATFSEPGSLVGNPGAILHGEAVHLAAGGLVINGATNDTQALMTGYGDVGIGAGGGIATAGDTGTVVNFGTIAAFASGTAGQAIYLGAGGTVTNSGLITGAHPGSPVVGTAGGYPGVIEANNAPATVVNLGTIANPNNSNGVNILRGGLLLNGLTAGSTALITAPHGGIYMGGSHHVAYPGAVGTIVNYGTLQVTGTASDATLLSAGGTVINRGLITSTAGAVAFQNTAGTVINFTTIVSTEPQSGAGGAGAYLGNGGEIINRGLIDAVRAAVSLDRNGTATTNGIVSNFATLIGSTGIVIATSGSTGNNTIVNYGTIIGTAGMAGTVGTSVQFGAGHDELVIEAGSTLVGVIAGMQQGDTVDLPFLTFANAGTITPGANNVLDVIQGAANYAVALDPNQNFAGDAFQLAADGGGGTLVTEVAGRTAPVVDDFYGFGTSDVLWQNAGGGGTATWIWQMNGLAQTGGGASASGGGGYQIAAAGDFNADGKADILWTNPASGDTWIWTMNGTAVTANDQVGAGGAGYDIVGTGDFYGTGTSDILWNNPSSGDTWIWQMNGSQIVANSEVGQGGSGYQILGTGSFSPGGNSDILWENPATGDTWIWTMNGSTVAGNQQIGVGGAGYDIVGTGDFYGTGTSDILWSNPSTGDTWIWQMNGSTIVANTEVGQAGAGYQVVGTGDYNGDGKADILWENPNTGDTWIWAMNGSTVAANVQVGQGGGGWSIVNTDPAAAQANGAAAFAFGDIAAGAAPPAAAPAPPQTGGGALALLAPPVADPALYNAAGLG